MSQESYLEILLKSEVLQFGTFKTKSGRLSPYFFNSGNLCSGSQLGDVAEIYAQAIARDFPNVTNLFGPAYKGIPLAVSTSEKLAKILGRDITYTFNRKEAKDHGEKGSLVGHSYDGSEHVVIIEDVITGGTSFSEVRPLLTGYGVDICGLIVGVDRQEQANTGGPVALAVQELYGCPLTSLINLDYVIEQLSEKQVLGKKWIDGPMMERINEYRNTYS
jgi:orotate phosphoribosyltransferase